MGHLGVVIPLYNKRETVGRALASVAANDLTLIDEIIVVNDGSTDGGEQVVEAYTASNPKIRVIHQPNGGVSAARNAGIRASRCEHVLLLDADDEWRPNFVSTIAGLMARCPEAVVFATACRFVWANGTETQPRYAFVPEHPEGGYLDSYLRSAAHGDRPVNCSCVGLRREAFDRAGGFPVGASHGEDKVFWLRMAGQGRFAWSPKVECIIRETRGNNSSATWSPASGAHYLRELRSAISQCASPEGLSDLTRNLENELGEFGRAAARNRHALVALCAAARLFANRRAVLAAQIVAALVIPKRLYFYLRGALR